MSKKITLLTFLLLIATMTYPVAAQRHSVADTVYTFRFVPQKDMFYVPMYDNENELARCSTASTGSCRASPTALCLYMSTDTATLWAARKKT